MPVSPTRSSNAAGEVDGVLAGERVGDQQNLMRAGGAAHFRRLAHHRLVEGGAAGGIEHAPRRSRRGGPPRSARFAICDRRLAGDDRQRVDAHLPAEHGKLLHRRRTARIERSHQHLAPPLSARRLAIFAVVVVLPEPCSPTIMISDRRRRVEVDRLSARPQGLDQLIVHDLHDHLAGRDRLDDIDADRALLHLLGEGAGHIERDVGLEHRAPHLAQRRLDILLRQRAAPGQAVEDRIQTFGEIVEHASFTLRSSFRAPRSGEPGIHSRKRRGYGFGLLAEPVIGPATSGRTRWLGPGMTPRETTNTPEGALRCRAGTSGISPVGVRSFQSLARAGGK